MRARRCGDEHATQLFDVVAEIAVVADVHRVSLAAFNVFGDHSAADARGDSLLHVGSGQAVARGFLAVHFDVDVEAL